MKTCDVCGDLSPTKALYCGACGTKLSQQSITSTLEQVISGPTIRGELKFVTVLFADLVSSTEMVARLDPEEAMQQLRPALETMCWAVETVGGTVFSKMGDGIMALFGAPRAHEGHAVLACHAAISIRDAFQPDKSHLAVRVGLHCGEVVAHASLEDLSSEPSAYGLALHVGSRLLRMADPGSICITETCFRLVQSFFDAASLGRFDLTGVPDPVELFLLARLRPVIARERFRGITLSPFRGRNVELNLLKHTLFAAEADRQRVACVIGESGAGKSRLCFEFVRWCRERHVPVFEARAQPYGAATPLRPILELLRAAYFQIAPGDEPQLAAAAIAQSLRTVGFAEEADLALVCDFLGVAYSGEVSPLWLNPRARKVRLYEIIRDILQWPAITTSVLLIEDLHWLDEASDEFVSLFADAVATTQTMLLVNFRPGYARPWMGSTPHRRIELTELAPIHIAELIDDLIGPDLELDTIRDRVAERSGGNPFFAEELVRSLVDNAVLVGPPGQYERSKTVSEGVLPATVQAVLAERIDRLTSPERDLLRICAVIGKEVEYDVLEWVVDQPPHRVEHFLDRLCSAGLLHPLGGAGARRYAFRHPLLQEVAYSSQLRSSRSKLHAKVADATERIHADHVTEFAGLLAYHFEEGGELQRAASHAAHAARRVGLTSPSQAIRYWQKVRTLIADAPRSHESDILRMTASSQIAWLGWREGLTTEQAQPYIHDALTWARHADDSIVPLLMFVESRMAQVSGGPADKHVQTVRQAMELAVQKGQNGRIATLNVCLSHAYGWAGLLREALSASDAALGRVSEIPNLDHQFLGYNVEHWAQSLRGRILLRLGRFRAARVCFDYILGIQDLIDPTVRGTAHLGYVDLAWCLEDWGLAAKHVEGAERAADLHPTPYSRLYVLALKGISLGIAKDYDAAVAMLTETLEFQRKYRAAVEYEPELLATLADYLGRKGHHSQAIRTAQAAIDVAGQRNSRLVECRAKIVLARHLLFEGGDDASGRAATMLDQAEALIQITGASIYASRLDEARSLLPSSKRGQSTVYEQGKFG